MNILYITDIPNPDIFKSCLIETMTESDFNKLEEYLKLPNIVIGPAQFNVDKSIVGIYEVDITCDELLSSAMNFNVDYNTPLPFSEPGETVGDFVKIVYAQTLGKGNKSFNDKQFLSFCLKLGMLKPQN